MLNLLHQAVRRLHSHASLGRAFGLLMNTFINLDMANLDYACDLQTQCSRPLKRFSFLKIDSRESNEVFGPCVLQGNSLGSTAFEIDHASH